MILACKAFVTISPSGTLSSTLDYAWAADNMNSYLPIQSSMTNGSGISQVNNWANLASAVAGSGNWDIDLTDLDNVFGTVSFSKVKIFLITLDEPDGALKVTVNQGNTNAFTSIPVSEEVFSVYYKENSFNGWNVSGGNKMVRVTNPTASTVNLSAWIVGIS